MRTTTHPQPATSSVTTLPTAGHRRARAARTRAGTSSRGC
jgi:hypothetical protein